MDTVQSVQIHFQILFQKLQSICIGVKMYLKKK